MNKELIKQLAEQAGAVADYGVTGVDDKDFLIMSGDDIEKFAELIIKKCGEIADCDVEYGIPSNAIERYFGIK